MATTAYRVLALLLATGVQGANACDAVPGAHTAESERYVVSWRMDPEPVTGRHFAMDLAVCPKPGMPAVESVAVDAHMPEHRHGMNYRVTVVPADGGRYRAEGFMFHMPGRWEVVFTLRSAGRTDRIARSVTLR